MSAAFSPVFDSLRSILRKHSGALQVKESAQSYSLCAKTGPATLKAWGGKLRSPVIPVAWVEVSKSYVSYHLMGVYGNPKLLAGISPELKARMQGKTCFHFKTIDESLFTELDELTVAGIAAMRKAEYVTD